MNGTGIQGGSAAMTGGGEIIGDLAQSALTARAVEPVHGEGGDGHSHETVCLNCGTVLVGSHCHQCGQAAHVHKTIGAFFHDLLHGVFHFEGKIWRTLPLLAFKPGKLTREYVDGRRASYVSPVALFLFAVFLLFAVVKNTHFSMGDNADIAVNGKHVKGLEANRVELARLEQERACILVVMGATVEGRKELVAIADGFRENEESWLAVLRDLKRRGLAVGPQLAVGDGALGFWKALAQVYRDPREQRCWVHKTANILDKLPKSMQSKAKAHIHEMYRAESRDAAMKAYDHFVQAYRSKYPHAVACLEKDKDVLFTFYDFPATHWIHIRTSNPIESTFGTVRLRTHKTKGCGSRTATLTMVFKLALEAQKTWKRLKGHTLISLVLQRKVFINGELKEAA